MTEQQLQVLYQSPQTRSQLYRPLNTTAAEIRLVYIEPLDRYNNMIECDLRTVSLLDNAHPQYLALSYTWGDPLLNTEIFVNGCILKATTNLVAALHSLRSNWYQVTANQPVLKAHKELVGPIWIDAICIDQGNHEERSQQVQIMGKIYATANLVVSWLGEILPQHVAGMEALVQIHNASKTKPIHEDYSWVEENTSLWQWDYEMREPNAVWKSLERILNLPYWRRVWVIQELIMCKWALAMLGDKIVPFTAFRNFLNLCRAAGKSLKDPGVSPFLHIYAQIKELGIELSSLSNLLVVRYKFESKELMPLQWLLSRFSERLTTDPRDRIFGMLSIANTSMKADYNKSAIEVYQELALMWTDKVSTPSLDFFLLLRIQPNRTRRFLAELGTVLATLHQFSSLGHFSKRLRTRTLYKIRPTKAL